MGRPSPRSAHQALFHKGYIYSWGGELTSPNQVYLLETPSNHLLARQSYNALITFPQQRPHANRSKLLMRPSLDPAMQTSPP